MLEFGNLGLDDVTEKKFIFSHQILNKIFLHFRNCFSDLGYFLFRYGTFVMPITSNFFGDAAVKISYV
jgi:hypothetical protein